MSALINLDEKRIIKALMQGDFKISNHARKRMYERNVLLDDIICCAKTILSIQQLDGKYVVKGHDRYDDKLTIICAWDGNTLIITLY